MTTRNNYIINQQANRLKSMANSKSKDNKVDFFDYQRYEYLFELYPANVSDAVEHNTVNQTMLDSFINVLTLQKVKCSYAYILHDKDVFNDIEFDDNYIVKHQAMDKKKNHYHFCVHFNTPLSINELVDKFNLNKQFIEVCKNWDNSLLYLTHKTKPHKYQYPVTDIVTNIDEYVKHVYTNYIPRYDCLDYCLSIVNADINKGKKLSYKEFINEFINLKDIDKSTIRKDFQIVKQLINEHNTYIDYTFNPIQEKVRIEVDKEVKRQRQAFDKLEMLAHEFGSTSYINDNHEKFVLYKVNERKK